MNMGERARYTASWLQFLAARGILASPDEDGITWRMHLADALKGGVTGLVVVVLVTLFAGFLGAIVGAMGLGLFIGMSSAIFAVADFNRRPALNRFERYLDRLGVLIGHAPYDAPFAQTMRRALSLVFQLATWAALGALVASVLGVAADVGSFGSVIAALVGVSRNLPNPNAAAADPLHDEPPPVFGSSSKTETLEGLVNTGLSNDGPGGVFIGTVREFVCTAPKTWLRKAQWELRTHWLRFKHEVGGAIVFAPMGSGKTACLQITTALDNTVDSKFGIDCAGQLATVSIPWLLKSGHSVRIYNPTGLRVDHFAKLGRDLGYGPERYQPAAQCNNLGNKDPNDPHTPTKVRAAAAIFCKKVEGDNQAFFTGGAEEVTGSMGLLCLELLGPKANWPKVAEWLNASLFELNERFGQMLKSRYRSVRSTGKKFHIPCDENGKPKGALTTALRNVIETAQNESAFLTDETIAHMFSGPGDSFARMKDELCADFLIAQEAPSSAMQKATHLLLEIAKAEWQTDGDRAVIVLADEMAAAMPAAAGETFLSLYSLSRKHRIKVVSVVQSWKQLVDWLGGKNGGEQRADALTASAGALVFYGIGNDLGTGERIRAMAGKRTVWAPNLSPVQQLQSGAMAVELFDDNALRSMNRNGGQVVFIAGSDVCAVLDRSPYFKLDGMRERAAPDPFHP